MRISLLQLDVRDLAAEPAEARRERVAALIAAERGRDLVVLPELWPVGGFAYRDWAAAAEPVDGSPTVGAMSAAAREAGVWLHAGSIVERDQDGPLYNTSLLFGPDGELRRTYRKIHRFGFDRGEATLMGGGREIVTAELPGVVAGLATCYDLRFPEQFRLLVDAGARLLLVPASWPAARVGHWTLLASARAVESQCVVVACNAAGSHAGVPQGGHSLVVDPWGEVLAEAAAGDGERVLRVDVDLTAVDRARADFPVLRDRVLGLPTPPRPRD